jgi:hypothetical protein
LFSSDAATAKASDGLGNKISNPIFPFENNLLVVVSSDSQAVDKIRNDRPKSWGIIKE